MGLRLQIPRLHARVTSRPRTAKAPPGNGKGGGSNAPPDGPAETPAHRLRLPGFIAGDGAGLGDVIARTTRYIGIRPCGGCARRAVTLNRWLTFSPRRGQ